MHNYNSGVFSAEFQTDLGQKVWFFLNSFENIIRMETATDLSRPAVEALEEPLLKEFGEKILADRIKQMIGHMTKQIMEQRGYGISQQNVKITRGAPFSRATRYEKKDNHVFYVFRNTKDLGVLGLTDEKNGNQLPLEGRSNWVFWKSFVGGLRGRIAFGLEDEKIAQQDITTQGFHIYKMPRLLKAKNA